MRRSALDGPGRQLVGAHALIELVVERVWVEPLLDREVPAAEHHRQGGGHVYGVRRSSCAATASATSTWARPTAARSAPAPSTSLRRSRGLDRIGYNGTITFESFSSAVVSLALTRALCIWRETWDDGMELATSARRFVTGRLAAPTA